MVPGLTQILQMVSENQYIQNFQKFMYSIYEGIKERKVNYPEWKVEKFLAKAVERQ